MAKKSKPEENPYLDTQTERLFLRDRHGNVGDAFVEGYTKESIEWRANARQIARKNNAGQKLHVGKNGSYIDLKGDSKEISDEERKLLDSITNIEGVPGFEFSAKARDEFLMKSAYNILLQWEAHLDQVSKALGE